MAYSANYFDQLRIIEFQTTKKPVFDSLEKQTPLLLALYELKFFNPTTCIPHTVQNKTPQDLMKNPKTTHF